jgi:hypothetical protein
MSVGTRRSCFFLKKKTTRENLTTISLKYFSGVANYLRTEHVWARILKHWMEAEKSTFRGELSFHRSECTVRFTVATIFVVCFKDLFLLTVWKKKTNLVKWRHICILLLWKHLQTYLPALNSHCRPNRHLKIFKNSGSEPEFLNIYWRLKSRLFKESCLFKGHSVQSGDTYNPDGAY